VEPDGRLTDAELWERASGHDGAAFGELFDRHATRVYNHCFRRTADWTVAEDLTSVVFLEAWRKRRQVRLTGDSILPWLLAVANNCLRNTHRARRRYRRLLAALPRAQDAPSFEPEATDRLDDVVAMQRIIEVLARLSPEDQEIVSLCDLSGLSYDEAARALGLPVGTVKSRLSRARERLRGSSDLAAWRTGASAERGGMST
jgi:RNA polymerase sigma-70 factor (ECF subfamily)